MISVIQNLNRGPKFPLELEMKIFQTATKLHRGTGPTLLRVAHRIFLWLVFFVSSEGLTVAVFIQD
jgi:hypothetical protein